MKENYQADGFGFLLSGVISGVGKGIIASSVGLLLKTTGLTVTYLKIDPYLNQDAGTMNPVECVSLASLPVHGTDKISQARRGLCYRRCKAYQAWVRSGDVPRLTCCTQGGEMDLDIGNSSRFLATTLTKDHNITTGKIYQQVLDQERRGDFLGKTVQV